MPTYCDKDIIQVKMPEPYPELIKVRVEEANPGAVEADFIADWEAELDNLIAKFSEYIDTQVGNAYQYVYKSNTQKFADVTDSPKTPAVIYEICRLLCIDGAFEYYFKSQRAKNTFEEMTYRELAEKELERLRKGDITINLTPAVTSYNPNNATRTNVFTETNFCKHGKGRY